jgi:predicted permease
MAEHVRNPFQRKTGKGSQRTGAKANGDGETGARADASVSHADSGVGSGDGPRPGGRARREDKPRRRWRAESLLQDVRFALRTLRKSWGFTLTAVLTLALGIGANTAIFQLLDAVRLRSLPVADPGSLAGVQVKNGNRGFGITISDNETSLTYPLWEQIRLHQEVFSNVFAWADSGSAALGEGAQMRRARGLWVSGDTFITLGIYPVRGRFFTAQDDKPGCGLPGVVISYGVWQSEFGGQDSAIGSRLIVDGRSTEVIGVTPRSFFGLEVGKNFDFAAPFCAMESYFPGSGTIPRKDYFWVHVLGRLKPGISWQQASSKIEAMSPGIIEETLPSEYSATALEVYRRFRLAAFPGGNGVSWLRDTYDTSLRLLLVITALVLLIACANLGNLMLARASTREREMAVRLALGASRWRLIRQLLSEGLLLAAGGAALGIVLAEIFSRSLVRFLSVEGDPIQLNLSMDWRVLVFTGLVAVQTCLVFGLVPALRSSGASPGWALKTGGRGTTAGSERFSFQRLLVVSQLAVSVVLLVGAVLFVRSFWSLLNIDPGFRERGILVATVEFRRLELSPERTPSFIREMLQQIRTLPQVESAATSTHIPLNGSSWNLGVHINGLEGGSKFTWTSPGYFRTMGIPILAGRDFDERDTRTSPKVAVVNEAFARKYLAGQNPIGRVVRTNAEPDFPEAEYEIVGLIKNTLYNSLREPTPPMSFAPAEQFPPAGAWTALFIRSSYPAPAVMRAVREKLSAVNAAMTMEFHVLDTDIRNGLLRERLMAILSGFFGALAALLAMIGLYGLISYTVAMRKNEIGISMALGATSGSVTRIIVRQTLALLAVGIGGGLVLALAAGKGANTLLYGLQANDPLTLLGAAGFLVVGALTASYIPAYRASRVDPMNALRYE